MEPWTRQLLSIIVSQICKTIGWHSISTTSLQILVDVLHRYLKQLGTNIHGYSEHFNHTLPALEEISLAFIEMGINVEDLKEYVDYVSSIPLKIKAPKYPLEKKSSMNFLKPGSREVVTRPVHIHEHLPAMYPELSEEYSATETTSNDDSLPSLNTDSNNTLFKKSDNDLNKRMTQIISEEVGRPLRELSCVMMTTSGFLSSAREGKAPEARIPKLNNYSNVLPSQPSYPTVPPEVRSEHKKSKESSKIVNHVKPDRKREEVNGKDDFDDSKIKKLTNLKELNKLKAFKPIHKTVDTNDSPKMIRPEKLKLPAPPSPKESKPKPTKNEKPPEKVPEPEIIVEEKLATEPNKQKLNIFKRLSKVKEERAESPVHKLTAKEHAQINESIEAVVKGGREKDEIEKINREEKIKPIPIYDKSPEPLPEQTSKHLKRKKKQKFHEIPNKKMKEINHEPEEIEKPKPKLIEIESEIPLASVMSNIHNTPALAALKQNPLIPKFPPNFMNMNRFDSTGSHPEMPNLPLPPAALMQANVDPIVRAPSREPELKFDQDVITDKKLKKKMKKDKREKDKKKIKKDKIKSKEKLEKKREKLKLKNKNKIKKEKKFNLEKEMPTEDPSVPKLKLKLGNANSPQLSPSGIQSPKIFIKPIVKHDDLPKSPEPYRESSPELAKISALIGKPMKKSKLEIPSTSFSKSVEPITIKTNKKSVVIDSKPKNKEKQKIKKEEKFKPTPYYYDADGNQIWVCPTCGDQDDGTPMIGCDGCDAWYHWVCVGIKSPPDSAKWFCVSCANP